METTPTLTRRGLLGIGATAIPVLTGLRFGIIGDPYAADRPTGSQPHGSGYYRFSIGSMIATVISDGCGNVPFWPIFAANQPASTTEAFLKENRLGQAPQLPNNLLVVDIATDRVLVDTGFGDVLGPTSGQFPWMLQNLERAGIPAESITMVIITHIHLDHVAGIVTKSGEHVFPKGATRKRILGQVAAERSLVMGYHFPFPGLGYEEIAGPAYRWNSVPWTW